MEQKFAKTTRTKKESVNEKKRPASKNYTCVSAFENKNTTPAICLHVPKNLLAKWCRIMNA